MADLYLLYAVVGVVAVMLALVSRRMREIPLSEPMVVFLLGLALGPHLLGQITLSGEMRDIVLLEGSRLIVAISVMGAALRFPASGLRDVARPVLLLLAVAMPLAAGISALGGLLLGLPVALALALGACLCPTDPVLAGSVVSGDPAERDLPERVRHTLSVESGINDGLALPLVGLAIAVALPATSPGTEIGRLTFEVVVGVLVGAALGALAGWGVRAATAKGDLEPAPDLIITVLLAVAVLGVAKYAGASGVLAVFAAGTVYNAMSNGDEREPQQGLDEAVNRYISLPLFFVLGIVAPVDGWLELGWPALAFAAVVLFLRRPPVLLALSRPLGLGAREAAFLGWFGPMGVSSIFYLAHSMDEGVTDPRFFAAGTFMVAVSIMAFGMTSSPGRNLYARRAAASSR